MVYHWIFNIGMGFLSEIFGIRLGIFSTTVLLIVVASLLISHISRCFIPNKKRCPLSSLLLQVIKEGALVVLQQMSVL